MWRFSWCLLSLKGVSGEVVILEEAAYCDAGLVSEVVVPLLSMQSSVLLCISTLLDGSNHYSKMIALRDETGKPVFESIAISLVCEACLKSDHPEKCTHRMSEVPRWISSKKVEVVRTLLSEDPAMLLRETLGISSDGSEKLFRSDDIEAFEKREDAGLVWIDRDHRLNVMHFFVAVDPSGGGPSAFSICSMLVMPNGALQVLGLEALITRDVRKTHELLLNHLKMIRRMPLLENATAVLSFESNLAFESQHLLHALHQCDFKRWVSLAEGAQGALGWLTTNSRKESMALLVRECLRVGRISYSRFFFSISMTRDEAKTRLGNELRNFSVVTEPPKTHFAKTRKTYTGKLGGLQDDCAIALQLVMAAQRVFFEDVRYASFSNQPIWQG